VNELTDLEICQRIAEIENLEHYISENKKYCMTRDKLSTYVIRHVEYNPLTDDALCFSLMLRHEVSLTYGEYAVNAEILIEKEDGEHSFSTQAYCPKRAICLAIIMSKV
jgi:hypothetical protein